MPVRWNIFCGMSILLFSCFMPALVLAGTEPQVGQPSILVTGFEPFGGDTVNGSWEAVRHLEGQRIAGRRVLVRQLPVVWQRASKELEALIRRYHPEAVVAFGVAGAEPVRVEMVAKNVRDMIRDNAGNLPASRVIQPGAPSDLRTTLNSTLIVRRLQEAAIPVTLSEDAGGYLCNETFFNLMNFTPSATSPLRYRGFIHVPPPGARVAMPDGSRFLFDRAALEKAADVVLRAVAEGLQGEGASGQVQSIHH